MERKRGISITSAVLQFAYRDCVINLLDTPGHGDFSEDTYRVLAAVDAAVMLLDAAKGLEPQTLKLFDVCRSRGHPGAHLRQQVGPARPGGPGAARRGGADDRAAADAGHLAGRGGRRAARAGRVRDRRVHPVHPDRGRRHPGRPPRWCRPRRSPPPSRSSGRPRRTSWRCCARSAPSSTRRTSCAGWPRRCCSGPALTGTGVQRLLDALVELAPPPEARDDADGRPRDLDAPLSGLVFKVQAGHGPQPPGPDGVRPDLLRPVRARHGAHPRRHRPPVRHQVRPGRVRPAAHHRRGGVPRRHRRAGQRRARCGRGTPSTPPTRWTSRPSRASPPSTSRWSAGPTRARSSSSARASSSSTARA